MEREARAVIITSLKPQFCKLCAESNVRHHAKSDMWNM